MGKNNLNLFANELNQDQTTQNEQINLALQGIADWGNRLKSQITSVFSDDGAASTSSTGFTTIPNWENTVKTTNPIIRVDVTLCVNPAGNVSYLALVVDDTVKRQIKMSSVGETIVTFSETFSTYVGSHKIQIQWKTNTGTISKIQDGGSRVIVTNLV